MKNFISAVYMFDKRIENQDKMIITEKKALIEERTSSYNLNFFY